MGRSQAATTRGANKGEGAGSRSRERGEKGYGLCRCLATNVSIVKIAPFHVCRKCQTVPAAQINCHMPPDEPPSLLLFVAVPSQCCALGIYRVNADPVNLFTFRQRATEMTLYGCMPQKAAARLDFCFFCCCCIYIFYFWGAATGAGPHRKPQKQLPQRAVSKLQPAVSPVSLQLATCNWQWVLLCFVCL